MPRCYMVKKGGRHEPPPRSPTEAAVAPPCYSPDRHAAITEPVQYAELGGGSSPAGGEGAEGLGALHGRSAADTEAAHELLSLAQSVPPLPPAVLTVLQPPESAAAEPLLPLYTYTIQPTNIYILADDPPEPLYQAMPVPVTIPLQTIEYVDPQINYVTTYQTSEETQTEFTDQYGDNVAEPKSIEPEPEAEPESVDSEGGSDSQPKESKKSAKYDCSECGKRYATSSNLSRHKQTHRSLDSVAAKRCGECGKAYVSMPALAMHVLTHRMGHVCGVCGKQFSRPWLLRGHLRSHTGEKPYSCAACGKAFADRSNLRAHLQTHSSDKKHECARCRKSFALKSYLNKHQEAACVRDDE